MHKRAIYLHFESSYCACWQVEKKVQVLIRTMCSLRGNSIKRYLRGPISVIWKGFPSGVSQPLWSVFFLCQKGFHLYCFSKYKQRHSANESASSLFYLAQYSQKYFPEKNILYVKPLRFQPLWVASLKTSVCLEKAAGKSSCTFFGRKLLFSILVIDNAQCVTYTMWHKHSSFCCSSPWYETMKSECTTVVHCYCIFSIADWIAKNR